MYKRLVLSLYFLFLSLLANATNYTFVSPSVTPGSTNGCALTTYTFNATNNNCPGPCIDPVITIGTSVTITFPVGMDASTITTGTFEGNAITFITKTATSVTFNAPTQIIENISFAIVLNNVTNGTNISGNITVSVVNNSAGTSSASVAINTSSCPAGPSEDALKYVVFDFEGYQSGSTTVPNGAYRYNDINYSIQPNPLAANDQIADRCLKVDWNYSAGYGGLGRGMTQYIDMDPTTDYINFYFYNPTTNSKSATVTVLVAEDDNNNNIDESDPYDGPADYDDVWVYTSVITRQNNWQLISIPLNSLTDRNTAGTDGGTKGNGVFDAQFSASGGSILKVAFEFGGLISGDGSQTYYMDMIAFSEGPLPRGATITDLPSKAPEDYCMLGAFDINANSGNPQLTAGAIEGIFNPLTPVSTRKLCIVNRFLAFAFSGTTPNVYPGAEVQTILNNGNVPMITWEPMFSAYTATDPSQVTLAKINAGNYDTYIDNFADVIKTYTGNILIRLMHEFDGNWYAWGIPNNGANLAACTAYINAFRRFKDRFVARGTNNVQWVFCSNAAPVPQASYNFFVNCYPGDSYVDIVASDIYNAIGTGTPLWKSFRTEGASSIYYLQKHFPSKPIYITEYGCRERTGGEPVGSETKAQWLSRQNKDVQSYFSKIRALIAFSYDKSAVSGEWDWRLNSSNASRDVYKTSFWQDSYYVDACNSVAPVSLLSFNANYLRDENSVILTWVSSYEKNNKGYFIEKSLDGNNYSIIGFIKGKGESNIESVYHYYDLEPIIGLNYYRLKQEDFDGELKTYHTTAVRINEENNIKIFPNPFSTELNIFTNNTTKDIQQIELFDLQGKSVYKKGFTPSENITFNIPQDLIPGTYFIKIVRSEMALTFKITKE